MATLDHLKRRTERKRRIRANRLVSFYVRFRRPNVLVFETLAQTTPGAVWEQMVELVDLPVILKRKNSKKARDRIQEAIASALRITCDCPDFHYGGFKFILTKEGVAYGKGTNIFPKVRNPGLKGSCCKHLHNALTVLPYNWNMITKDVARTFKL